MEKAHHKILYTVHEDIERGGSPPRGHPQKVLIALSSKQQDLSILSKGECFWGSQNWLNMLNQAWQWTGTKTLLQGWDIWPCLCCFLPCGPWLSSKVSGESIYLTKLNSCLLMALGLGKRRAQEGQNLFLLISVEIETGTWNYFLLKIKQKKLFPQKKLISDLEWRMEARWIFRIISDLYKGSQASGRHRERQVLDSVDQQLDQASPETNILWNFLISWPDKSFL